MSFSHQSGVVDGLVVKHIVLTAAVCHAVAQEYQGDRALLRQIGAGQVQLFAQLHAYRSIKKSGAKAA